MKGPMDSSRHPLEAMVIQSNSCNHSASTDAPFNKPKAPSKLEFWEPKQVPSASMIDLSGIDRPALLLNSQAKIKWQNKAAKKHIWHSAGAVNTTTVCGIFDLLFDPVFKRQVANYSDCLKFFVYQLYTYLPKDRLLSSIRMMNEEQKATVSTLVDKLDPSDPTHRSTMRYLHQILKDGSSRTYEVAATNFQQERLLVFELQEAAQQQRHPVVLKPPPPRAVNLPETVKVPYILLAAQLDNAVTLRYEMLADEYQRLISDLCLKCLTKIEHHGGVFGKHIESGFFAYFYLDQDRETVPIRFIECIFEIQEMMVDLAREWKIRKCWSHDIKLNMGLHWEKGYLGRLMTSVGEMLTSYGVGLQVAGSISQLAQDGQIWATKALINQIPPQIQIQLRFGILRPGGHRHQNFIRKGFAPVKDIFAEKHAAVFLDESMHQLPITQIFDRSGLTAPPD
jgi:class 3 adenylate cyclase